MQSYLLLAQFATIYAPIILLFGRGIHAIISGRVNMTFIRPLDSTTARFVGAACVFSAIVAWRVMIENIDVLGRVD